MRISGEPTNTIPKTIDPIDDLMFVPLNCGIDPEGKCYRQNCELERNSDQELVAFTHYPRVGSLGSSRSVQG